MLYLTFNENFDVYDAVKLEFTDKDNKLCADFDYDMTKNN